MVNILNKKFNHTTLLTVACFSFLGGLLLGRYQASSWWLLSAALVLTTVTFSRRSVTTLLSVVLLAIGLGMLRGEGFAERITSYEELYGSAVTLRVSALSDAVYADNGQLEFEAGEVEVLSPQQLKLPGSIKVQGFGVPAVARDDLVLVSGNVYPAGGARQGKVSFANLALLAPDSSLINKVRRTFVAGVFSAIPEPEASFGLGLLIGQRTTLPDYLEDQLSIAGLTHIIAVSGYNLTIIVRMVRRALGRRSKYQSTMGAFVLVGLFVLVTGFSASIVRAAVVSSLSLLAWYYGRSVKPLLLLGFSAALTAGWNPIYVWSDIGWYLSFLAFYGVLVLAPLVKQRLYGEKQQKLIGQVVLESVCAQLMAAPLILYIFGEVSIVALLSNAVIVPLVPLAMLATFIAGLGGMALPVLAGIIAIPATMLLTYILDLVAIFSQIPHALIHGQITFANTLYLYGVVVFFTVLLRSALKRRYARITERNIIE